MDPALLDMAVQRAPVNDDGRSGATLERVLLADGTRVVVKRFDPSVDLVMQLSGDTRGREVELFQSGLLDRLPPKVQHSIIAGWYDDDGLGVLVMRDLGTGVLTWNDTISAAQARTMFEGFAALHDAFRGAPPLGLMELGDIVGLFEPRRLQPYAGAALVDHALRGWEYWLEVAPGEVGERVLALALDTTPLVEACAQFPATLLHGDLATVNMAFEPDRPGSLTLIDWGLAAAGPAELDVGRLIAGCAQLFGPLGDRAGRSREGRFAPSSTTGSASVSRFGELLELHRITAGASYDEKALRLGLLEGLVWLGWNKSLDIVEHPDPEVRERERTALTWWLHQAELAFETGVI
jgi:hypothetical protein